MPKHHGRNPLTDETNPLSIVPDGRSSQADYYRLENRERQLEAINNLTDDEKGYVLGGVSADDLVPGNATESIKKAITKVHEKDLIELRALVYLQRLPDTSPELIQLKAVTNLGTREQIATFIAQKQINKLMMSQIDQITGAGDLTTMYKGTIKRGPDTFKSLWG